MNKKFLSAILFGALMVTSTGTFVSCKDFGDDIDNVQEQVNAAKSDISALQSQVATLQTALTTAQSTADAAKSAAAAAQATGDAALAAAEAGFGQITLVAVGSINDRYAAVPAGDYAIGYGAWGGAAFYPFNAMRCYTDETYAGTIHESCGWDPTKATIDITFD
mgnify:CR=1 FL=1